MKRSTLLKAAVMAVAAITTMTACKNDAYDSGTGPLSLTRADFVEAHTGNDCAVDYVLTDDGRKINLSSRLTAGWLNRPDTLYRAVLYYNVSADTEITDNTNDAAAVAEPVALSMVPVLSPKAEDSFKDGVRTDPVKFESMWLSAGGRYVNIGFYLKNGSTGDDNILHTIGMVQRRIVTNDDGTRTVMLQMYHDQGGVPEYYSSRYYVSVPCGEIDGDSVYITINTYDGPVTKKLEIL